MTFKNFAIIFICIILNISSCQNKSTSIKEKDLIPAIDFNYISDIQGLKYPIKPLTHFYYFPDQISELSKSINKKLVNNSSDIKTLNHYSFRLLGASAGGFGPPVIKSKNDIENSITLNKVIFDSNLIFASSDKKEWNKLPYQLQKDIIELYLAIFKAKKILNKFNQPVIDYLNSKSFYSTHDIQKELITPWCEKEMSDFSLINIVQQIDLKMLSFASRLIFEKINLFIKYRKVQFDKDFKNCTIKTTLGNILINGAGCDTINGNYLFTIDLGGDDLYQGNIASSKSINEPIGISIDLSGNDSYLSQDGFIASGILGIGALIDLQGKDQYICNNSRLVFSLFGCSLLLDYCGDDLYQSNCNYSQGSSIIGSSIFMDVFGDDKYSCGSYSQGFGGTLGVGIFIDKLGNDIYNTNTNSNINFIQGAAKGRWAEATDGQNLAGGLGIFIDHNGHDKYYASSFSQGASYYFGLGIFNDKQGDDEYNAISHSQGYAVHFSLASFNDFDGNDTYNKDSDKNKLTQIIGCGRDLSAGIFIDHKGYDAYYFGNRSVAIGDHNGIGIMQDLFGNDSYSWYHNKIYSSSESLGQTFPISKGLKQSRIYPIRNCSLELMVDTKGRDQHKTITIP